MFSKNNRKYRNKIIAENHLNKEEQEAVDEVVKYMECSYKELYHDTNKLASLIGMCKSLWRIGNTTTREV